jgi:hypothetical protein
LIHLQDPSGAASFVQEVHRLLVTAGFEGLGHRASRVTENDASTPLRPDRSLVVKSFFDVVLDLMRCLKVEN